MIAIVKVSVTFEMVQLNCLARGTRKTLQAYTAPRAICSRIPANAIHQRSNLFITSPLLQRLDVGGAAEVSHFRIAISGSALRDISQKAPPFSRILHRVVFVINYQPRTGRRIEQRSMNIYWNSASGMKLFTSTTPAGLPR